MDFLASGYDTPDGAARRAHEDDISGLIAVHVTNIRHAVEAAAPSMAVIDVHLVDRKGQLTLGLRAVNDFFGDPALDPASAAFASLTEQIATDLAVIYNLTPMQRWTTPRLVDPRQPRTWHDIQ
ncbi:hypothetical protein ND748_01100 [Frankia sp. AiPs1]|uniref:hypothetical protein n=1 Tax=Frankia sp. AiPs1 TaxID=573493 RepID=UPI0020441139|nr:hypothetical protein [Frankia sp. AiPs1]MCM3920286.1 hypothetical protein [Frankia sp. AiPs1]